MGGMNLNMCILHIFEDKLSLDMAYISVDTAIYKLKSTGPSCSKLTVSLVYISLKL